MLIQHSIEQMSIVYTRNIYFVMHNILLLSSIYLVIVFGWYDTSINIISPLCKI